MAQKISQCLMIFSNIILIILMIISKSTCTPNLLGSFCSNTTMFANNSQYQANLNTLFHYLSSNATNPTGYHQAVAATGNTTQDTIYGHFLCRGDLNASTCQDCVSTATTTELPKNSCPNRKEAVIWYDECMVRYSNNSFFNKMDNSPSFLYWNVHNITGNQTRFMDLMSNMMNNEVAVRAATGGQNKKFAVDYVNSTVFQTIYGLGQCTPDLSSSDCDTCLAGAVGEFKATQGGRVLQPSCVVRYEVYSFFNMSFVPLSSPPPTLPPGPPQLPPQPSTPVTNITRSRGKKLSTKVIVAIVVPTVVVLFAVIATALCSITYKKPKKSDIHSIETGDDFSTVGSLQYELETLKYATNNFSIENKLGEGGFGSVYKGTLSNGQQIAVKRLSNSSRQGDEQFRNEVMLVAKLQHRNLVRLFGYTLEGQEKLLVYEYVPNKSLDNFLFDPECYGLLEWEARYKIIGGIARGMLYLHHDSQLRIIHRDLKASNVLLDADMNPKISDFGLAKMFGLDQSQGNTSRVVGTYGYMSPEYAMRGQFSIKSDVYAFGVLLLEIIRGKRSNTIDELSETEDDLLSYAWKQWRDGMPLEFVDPTIRDSSLIDEVVRCLHLGLLCVQESADDRPTMATVVLTLDSYSVTLPVPEAPGFFVRSRMEANTAKDIVSDQSSSKSTPWSVNDVSITEPEPR